MNILDIDHVELYVAAFGTSNIPALYEAKERELADIRDAASTSRA